MNICLNSNVAEVPNLRAYSLQTNQTQSLNASEHPAIILLRVDTFRASSFTSIKNYYVQKLIKFLWDTSTRPDFSGF